jgi:hypothetical protein
MAIPQFREEVHTIERFLYVIDKADCFLINKFEKFCHFTQKTVGITSVVWGRSCIVYGATNLSYRTIFPEESDMTSAWRWVGFGCIAFLMLRIYIDLGHKKPKIGSVITANVQRYTWEWQRKLWMTFLPIDVIYFIFARSPKITWGHAMLAAWYFLAVDDLPSQPSKLRLWLESLSSEPLPSEASMSKIK